MKKRLLMIAAIAGIFVPLFLAAPRPASANFYNPQIKFCYTGPGMEDGDWGILLYVPNWYSDLMFALKRGSPYYEAPQPDRPTLYPPCQAHTP